MSVPLSESESASEFEELLAKVLLDLSGEDCVSGITTFVLALAFDFGLTGCCSVVSIPVAIPLPFFAVEPELSDVHSE